MIVYIAGAYTDGDVAVNVRAAIEAGLQVIDAGHSPIIPHLAHFAHMQSPRSYETWMRVDRELLLVSDAVIRLPGPSRGADGECLLAAEHSIKIFQSVGQFVAWSGSNA